MKCLKIRRLIPGFLEGELSQKLYDEVSVHLELCKDCAKEKLLYEKSWQLIADTAQVEPEPGFKTRVWNRIVNQAVAKSAPRMSFFPLPSRLTVALATTIMLVTVLSITLPNYFQNRSARQIVSRMDEEEMAMVENIDLAENLDLIQDIDFFENMEVIENLDRLTQNTI